MISERAREFIAQPRTPRKLIVRLIAKNYPRSLFLRQLPPGNQIRGDIHDPFRQGLYVPKYPLRAKTKRGLMIGGS